MRNARRGDALRPPEELRRYALSKFSWHTIVPQIEGEYFRAIGRMVGSSALAYSCMSVRRAPALPVVTALRRSTLGRTLVWQTAGNLRLNGATPVFGVASALVLSRVLGAEG